MAQESETQRSPSTSTGTLSWPDGAMTALSRNRQGTVSTGRPLCAMARRARQQ